jgi:N-acetylglucosaminyldiphosphoundecaprenol N-acetyl-beta-D-mannosaminyltransferase
MTKIRLLNMDVDNTTMEDVLNKTEGTILTLHVDMIAKLQKDRAFYDLANRFDVITCDSQILYFASKALRTPFKERVSGSDYFPKFYMKYANDPSITIYLCGAMGDIAERAMKAINLKVGREMVVGAYGPPAGWEQDGEEVERMVKMIDESGASVVVVGLGAGAQERFIFNQRDRLSKAKLFLPLGGTIDYEAGDVRRPPAFITTAGLEWAWRLVREPGRRWRRYLVHQPPVMLHLGKQLVGKYRNPFA